MIDIGSLALTLSLVVAVYAVVISLVGALQRRRDLIASGEHAAFAVWGMTVVAVAALLHLLGSHDFNVEYVASYSSSTLPWNYTITALWGGQKGSLLFWQLILSSITAMVLLQNRDRNRDLMPYVTAVLMMTSVFFL